MPEKKGSKKYTTYLGLVDSGSSGSLVNKELVEYAIFAIKKHKKPMKWDTATGIFQTEGSVEIENYHLPQFTWKHNITTSFHMFQKRPKDKYDFILGHDLLKGLGLIIDYSASQFMWDNITVDMVPSGYWTKNKITSTAKGWNAEKQQRNEMHVTQILPADYKPTDIIEVVQNQTHLTADEKEQLQRMLFDFQDLFQGKCSKFKGEPIELELLPWSKPFYGKLFSIPKVYQQITKMKSQD
jgi:hypothetical protein